MNIIIPMAGIGKRMRPHTLTIPKPLIPVAGKPIVERLVAGIAKIVTEKIDQIAFVTGNFGEHVEKNLLNIAAKYGATGKIYYQKKALGTAHAVLCAEPALTGKVIVAFSDTLFDADFKIEKDKEATILVHHVDNPEIFGVVKTNSKGFITNFYEKPKTFVSNLAIIGIYYFKHGEQLKNELQYLTENKIIKNKEYQITDALENMKEKGVRFFTNKVREWFDCGNKDATINANKKILDLTQNEDLIDPSSVYRNTSLIEPCYIGKNVSIEDSVIGPYVSIGNDTSIKRCIISNSIIQNQTRLNSIIIDNAMIGNHVDLSGKATDTNIGDYSTWK